MSSLPKKRVKSTNRAATLADVGREAGVSAMSVSAVLNATKTSTRIGEKTRKRIEEAALKLGYRPNVAARALARRRMNTIGVPATIGGGELNSYFYELFNGIIEGAASAGQNTTLVPLANWENPGEQLSRLCDGRVDGMILIAPLCSAEETRTLPEHTPFVSVHANYNFPGTVNIESDDEGGARAIVNSLIEKGHRDILHISGPRKSIGAERRISGYKKALNDASIVLDPELLLNSEHFTSQCGFDLVKSWLAGRSRESLPSAIFCANDAIALGCMEAMSAVGLRVPDDISLCGFDDTLAARSVIPQLSTVRQPLREMGIRAVELLLEKINGSDVLDRKEKGSSLVFDTELVPRGSVAQFVSK